MSVFDDSVCDHKFVSAISKLAKAYAKSSDAKLVLEERRVAALERIATDFDLAVGKGVSHVPDGTPTGD